MRIYWRSKYGYFEKKKQYRAKSPEVICEQNSFITFD